MIRAHAPGRVNLTGDRVDELDGQWPSSGR
jgi:hypothetical protein